MSNPAHLSFFYALWNARLSAASHSKKNVLNSHEESQRRLSDKVMPELCSNVQEVPSNGASHSPNKTRLHFERLERWGSIRNWASTVLPQRVKLSMFDKSQTLHPTPYVSPNWFPQLVGHLLMCNIPVHTPATTPVVAQISQQLVGFSLNRPTLTAEEVLHTIFQHDTTAGGYLLRHLHLSNETTSACMVGLTLVFHVPVLYELLTNCLSSTNNPHHVLHATQDSISATQFRSHHNLVPSVQLYLVYVVELPLTSSHVTTELFLTAHYKYERLKYAVHSLVAMYQWTVNFGPSLTVQLVSTYWNNVHKTKHEQLAVAKEKRHLEKKSKNKKAKAACLAACPEVPQESSDIVPTPFSDAVLVPPSDVPQTSTASDGPDLSQIPGDLFGLLLPTKTRIILERLGVNVWIHNDEELYRLAAKYLCKLWDEHLILKPMTKVNESLNRPVKNPMKKQTREHMDHMSRSALLGTPQLSKGDRLTGLGL
ncbi:hypothetical protein B0H16DRAFT_1470979 [Mycena metata]|uniref:Uncharacterized protein n=1 Tax=Mycena metata TaxID=1033252 RepID=A0AAD7HSJ7_9AGAR|nr:hypothetical protein B0H16DRAFT_1470979 [Mycena metata]